MEQQMKITDKFTAVLEMVMAQNTKPQNLGFVISGSIFHPDTVSEAQSALLAEAGFKWQDTDSGGQYFVDFD
jgi:hypothetical protein